MEKKTVVIVEDEKPIAEAERLILESEYNVHLVHDGEKAIDRIRAVKPDLVILDLMLPKMSGIDVCKTIRNNKTLSHTKVVMVTAKNTDKDEMKGMDIGADDYIMKPFEPVELLHVSRQVLNK
ncbi:response regulator [Candidatus Woesearchaeota archaeon]|nr:response regulator [Candidatus Woesearchaeota archaeon]